MNSRPDLPQSASPAGSALRIAVYPYSDWARVESQWSQLVDQSPYSSFFLTVAWVRSWLESYGDLLKPEILFFHAEEEAVGACLLVYRTLRRGPFPVRCVFLNTAGEDEIEETCADFNNLLCLSGWERPVVAALKVHLDQHRLDEIAATGFAPGTPLDALSEAFAGLIPLQNLRPSYYVDLARLRDQNLTYEAALSKKTRGNVRRHSRKYGDVQLQAAADVPEALRMFEELTALHQSTWKTRGRSGSFAAPRKVAFLQELIRTAFPTGAIQVLRVSAAGETIGIKMNFLHRGKVYSYTSGLRYGPDPQMSPGIVTLAAIVGYCLEQGSNEYDFLAGDAQYKKLLSTDYRNLAWVVFQRPSVKRKAIEVLRGIKRRAAQLSKHASEAGSNSAETE